MLTLPVQHPSWVSHVPAVYWNYNSFNYLQCRFNLDWGATKIPTTSSDEVFIVFVTSDFGFECTFS